MFPKVILNIYISKSIRPIDQILETIGLFFNFENLYPIS